MDQNRKAYEAPTVKVYQFDENDLILTASGNPISVIADYAVNALNDFFSGTNTTIEK